MYFIYLKVLTIMVIGSDNMVIGISGKQGSGKTTIVNTIKDLYDIEVIHGDEIAHEVLTYEVYQNFLKNIGYEVPSNEVDRKYLGKIIFSHKDILDNYNAYIYEFIKARIEKIIQDKSKNYIIDWNFLPITSLFDLCDLKILVECDINVRRDRVKKRDNIDDEYFNIREKAGLDYDESSFDVILENNELKESKNNVKKILGGIIWK